MQVYAEEFLKNSMSADHNDAKLKAEVEALKLQFAKVIALRRSIDVLIAVAMLSGVSASGCTFPLQLYTEAVCG